jgi:uncharacterized protein (TIGR00251 family)
VRISVLAKPKKKRVFVEQITKDYYVVSVSEPPVDGKANQAIIKSLAKYFSISRSDITLVSGQTSKMKVFDVPDSLAGFEVLPKQKKLF